MADIIKLRRDTAANWTAANPILAEGEMGIETDTKLQKNGDGTTAWNSLPYMKVECENGIGDSEVKPMSQKAVTDEIINNGSAFDISAYNATDGVLAKYADLTAALTALNAIPDAYKHGGMSIKFVQSSDNKYVQFRYMNSSTAAADFANVDNWKGETDEIKAGSNDLVESCGVNSNIKKITKFTVDDFTIGGYYRNTGEYTITDSRHLTDFIPVKEGDICHYKIYQGNSELYTVIAFDSSKTLIPASSITGVSGLIENDYTVPSGVSYLRFCEGGLSTHTAEVLFANSLVDLNKKLTNLQSQVGNIVSSQYLILPFVTDVATTRLQVPANKRKEGFQIAYYNGIEFVVESALKTPNSDVGWSEESNWKRVEGHNEELYNLIATFYQNNPDMIPLVTRWDFGRLLADGSYVDSKGWRISNFISVTAGEVLHILAYSNSTAEPTIVCYDSNKSFVSAETGRSTFDGDYTVPTGISYIKIVRRKEHENCGAWRKLPLKDIKEIYKFLSINTLQDLSPSDNCEFLYFKTNFAVTRAAIKRVYNRADGFRLWLDIYEETHPNTAWQVQMNVNWSGIRTGFYEASLTSGPSYVKVGLYLFGEVSDIDSVSISVPIDCIEQDDPNPINDIFAVRNEMGQIISNGTVVPIHWREGRLDYNSGYTGWTNSGDYWNSGFVKLPAGNYKVTGNTTPNNRAPMVIKFNNDYTFNSIIVAGTSSVASYTFTLNEETIIACNTQATNVSNFRLEKLNEGSLDLCENFSEVNNQLYYKGQPIASESSISAVVTDLPVSDGTGIESGYAYIDSTDRTIKVKA